MRHVGTGGQSEHSPWAQNAGRHDFAGNANMKTDDLVALLSTNPEPVDRGSVVRTLCAAFATGSTVAVGIALVGLGVRSDVMTAHALFFLAVKLLFAAAIVSLALVYLIRLARPGGERRTSSL